MLKGQPDLSCEAVNEIAKNRLGDAIKKLLGLDIIETFLADAIVGGRTTRDNQHSKQTWIKYRNIPIFIYADFDMSNCCCSSQRKSFKPAKHRCPVNGVEYVEVPIRTVSHHIKESWLWDEKDQPYYFYDDPDCDVVYFGLDNSLILKSQVRTAVGVKDQSKDAMLCYCYGATNEDVNKKQGIRDFIIRKTKQGECSCETSNPSGTCCLKYFPQH